MKVAIPQSIFNLFTQEQIETIFYKVGTSFFIKERLDVHHIPYFSNGLEYVVIPDGVLGTHLIDYFEQEKLLKEQERLKNIENEYNKLKDALKTIKQL